ncbi:MAG TPA: RHS repeat-associated core domain-containing protein, partial [Nitrospiraceae bacterium]
DAPLDLFRMDFDDLTRVVLPHTNWRGAYDAGTDTTGTELVTWDFQFPASYRNAFHSDPEAPFRDLPDWFGSLIQDKADESGLIYMRNRYYDPATGRFTQEDPIGLAGGLNLYGFAGGDPINFSDPFGLCPECKLLLAAAGASAAADTPLPGPGDVVAAGFTLGAGILATKYWVENGGPQAVADGATVLFAKGLSWWDRLKIKIKIIVGTAATEGELQREIIERERARQEQVQEQKADQIESGEGKPPEREQEPN